MEWPYVLTIDHLDGDWHYEDGTPVILRREMYKSRTLQGIGRQYKKHNYKGSVDDLNCIYKINGFNFNYDDCRGITFDNDCFWGREG